MGIAALIVIFPCLSRPGGGRAEGDADGVVEVVDGGKGDKDGVTGVDDRGVNGTADGLILVVAVTEVWTTGDDGDGEHPLSPRDYIKDLTPAEV